MKRIKGNIKLIVGLVLGIFISAVTSYSVAATLIKSADVSYVDNAKLGATNVQAAIDGTCTKFSNDLTDLKTNLKKEILNEAYPVNSVYISYSNVNPGTLFGGTWEIIGDGRVLKGINSGAAGATGGSSTVTLTTSNLPAHTHTYDKANSTSGSTKLTLAQMPLGLVRYYNSTDAKAFGFGKWQLLGEGWSSVMENKIGNEYGEGHTHTISTTSTNSGSAGSSNPTAISVQDPYITVYMWKRTK